jgi:aminoglycoside phosphotransferase
VTTYKIEGMDVKTENAANTWEGRATPGQTLYRSRRNRYYIEFKGVASWAEWVSPEAAVRWLRQNELEIPRVLADVAKRVIS